MLAESRRLVASAAESIVFISGSMYFERTRLTIRRKLMPRSSIRGPSGTEKSAVTRINNSCRASLRGRNAASSLNSKPVRSHRSRALATLVKLFSGRKIVHRWRRCSGTCDSIPGFQRPNSARLTAAASVIGALTLPLPICTGAGATTDIQHRNRARVSTLRRSIHLVAPEALRVERWHLGSRAAFNSRGFSARNPRQRRREQSRIGQYRCATATT